ncbi:membrane dipeptidase [Jiella pelagia]|uniref:Membrane dipeptidase n=1 Tax=Jiella pelagia TaxID=2986949 RepID=A0ABY7BX93_9HYPH|nr:membrane dipeptidase [Jiella pelagia]WAP67369.1 membrane dipeptidase [Jiella pelagia]
MTTLHDDLIVFDGLIISDWGRPVFEAMQKGGLTAANCTCSVWENFHDTMLAIGAWNRQFREHSDLIVKAKTVADVRRAKEEGKTGIVLGFQNTSAFEDRLEFVEALQGAGRRHRPDDLQHPQSGGLRLL